MVFYRGEYFGEVIRFTEAHWVDKDPWEFVTFWTTRGQRPGYKIDATRRIDHRWQIVCPD